MAIHIALIKQGGLLDLTFALEHRAKGLGRAQRRIRRITIGTGKRTFGPVEIIEIGQDQAAMIFRKRVKRTIALNFIQCRQRLGLFIQSRIQPCLGQRRDKGIDAPLRQFRYYINCILQPVIADGRVHDCQCRKQVFGIFTLQIGRDRTGIGNPAITDQGKKRPATQFCIGRFKFMRPQKILRSIARLVFKLGCFPGKEIARKTIRLRILEFCLFGMLWQ